MSGFRDIYGHEKTIAHLKSAIVLDQVSHAYLISGDEGMGKKTLARAFAQTLQCENLQMAVRETGRPAADDPAWKRIDACGLCGSCKQAVSGNQADILTWPHEKPKLFSAWLSRVTRNLAISRLRETHAAKRSGSEVDLVLDELAECIPGGTDPQRVLEANELAEAVNRFLATLKPPERDTFVARYFYAASLAELSDRTGWTVGKTKTVLRRARLKLQTYLKEEGLC
jgi:RNA polymerase sigma factor (sigma-70 family)